MYPRSARDLIAITVLLLGSGGAQAAGETGIASIHAWHQVGPKTCIANHWHHGEGSGATQKEAEAKAIRMWVDFTAVDYGTDWMSYQRAESKSSKCERVESGWQCSVDARACKLTKRSVAASQRK